MKISANSWSFLGNCLRGLPLAKFTSKLISSRSYVISSPYKKLSVYEAQNYKYRNSLCKCKEIQIKFETSKCQLKQLSLLISLYASLSP